MRAGTAAMARRTGNDDFILRGEESRRLSLIRPFLQDELHTPKWGNDQGTKVERPASRFPSGYSRLRRCTIRSSISTSVRRILLRRFKGCHVSTAARPISFVHFLLSPISLLTRLVLSSSRQVIPGLFALPWWK